MKTLLAIFGFLAVIQIQSFAQAENKVKKSEIIETIDGKKYYLHFVKQGETLYQISIVYQIDPEEIKKINPDSSGELKAGKILKIPHSSQAQSNFSKKASEEDCFLYTVKSKETLYGISRKFNIGIEQIKGLNPEIGSVLNEGQVIKIPSENLNRGKSGQEPKDTSLSHTVLSGETLYSIARKYNLSLAELEKANPGVTGAIKAGQILVIPLQKDPAKYSISENKPDSAMMVKHVVTKGETIYSIAKAYSVEMDSIVKYNIGITTNIFIGQVLTIPNAGKRNYIWHKAEKNEKLQSIADKYNVSNSEIMEANPSLPKKIEKGQLVKIPVKNAKTDDDEKQSAGLSDKSVPERKCGNFEKNRHGNYKVALLVPFYLEQSDSLVFDSLTDPRMLAQLSPLKFMQFYEGFMLAVDSISQAGMTLDLYVYDVDNSSSKIHDVVAGSELDKMDLIIGPFFSEGFRTISDFAKSKKIKIINPLSVREEILYGNPYVFKVKPTVSSQTSIIANFACNEFSKSNIIIIRQNRYKFQDEVSYIKNYLNGHRATGSYLANRDILENLNARKIDRIFSDDNLFTTQRLSAKIADSSYFSNMVKEIVFADDSNFRFRTNLSAVRHNLVIVYSDEKVFSQELMSQLNKMSEDYNISLFGCPDWETFEDMETDQLVNLNAHWLTGAIIDYRDPVVKQWIQKFRKINQTEPAIEKYAFDGFDIGWYFLNALFRYGKDFESCLDDFHIRLLQNSFEFEQLKGNGFENTSWNVGEFDGYKFVRVAKYSH
jgi:LysM repeat protein